MKYGKGSDSLLNVIVPLLAGVFIYWTTTTDHGGFTHTSSYVRTDQYSQKGENSTLVVFASQSDIEDLVSSCPLAVEMAHKSNHQIRKAIKHDRNYLNDIFNVYNNGCKPVAGSE